MADAANRWFGRGFVPGQFRPPVESGSSEQDIYNRGRFFLRADEEKTVLFLDNMEDGFRYEEHSACDLDNRKRPWFFPCLKVIGKPCWLCEQRCPKKRVMALSVIDVDGFTYTRGEKAGTHVKNVKRLMVIPERELGLFVRKDQQVKQQGSKGLRGWKFKAYRQNDRTSNLGSDWTPVELVTKAWADAEKIDGKPFDYEEVIPIKKWTAEEQKRFFEEHPSIEWYKPKTAAAASSGGGSAVAAREDTASADDDIPF